MKNVFCLCVLCLSLASSLAGERVVSVGGGITEILHALELHESIVGVDTSSVYPESVTGMPQVGYARALSAEGVLSLNPTLVVCSEDAGPPTALQQVKSSGVQILQLPAKPSIQNVEQQIQLLAEALGQPERATPLIARIRNDLARAFSEIPPSRPRVLFVYARAGGVLNASGAGTHADAMIQLAGGINAVTGYEGYKPLTAEAALLAAPDVILLTTRGLAGAGGTDAILSHPGIANTPAAKSRRVVALDDLLLLGFSSRIGEAVRELSRLIHEEKNTGFVGVN